MSANRVRTELVVRTEPLISLKAAAIALGIHQNTLWKWLQRRKPPITFYRIGRRIMFKLSEINRFVEKCRAG